VKNKALAIATVTVVSILVTALFVYSQISELQNQISKLQAENNELQDQKRELENQLDTLQKLLDYGPEVQITNFSSRMGWWNPVGVSMLVIFDITISNNGISDVEGLTLEIKRYNIDEDPYNKTKRLSILNAGETIAFQTDVFVGMQTYFDEFYKRSFVASLKLGEVVLYVRHYLPEQW